MVVFLSTTILLGYLSTFIIYLESGAFYLNHFISHDVLEFNLWNSWSLLDFLAKCNILLKEHDQLVPV